MVMQTRNIPKKSELHRKLIKMIQPRIKMSESAQSHMHEKWKRAEEMMMAYLPETEDDAIRKSARENNGTLSYTTIQIPYTYAMVMSAHTYWTSVFFGRTPVHQFAGRHGESEQQTQALEALIDYQVGRGGMLGPYYIWILDAAKYGVGILGTYWDIEEIQYAKLSPGPDGGLIQTSMRQRGYTGNRAYNIAPYDFLPDPRVPVGRFQEGEFACVLKRISWNDILRRRALGYYMNIDELKGVIKDPSRSYESEGTPERPDINRTLLQDYDNNDHPAVVPAYEFYVELVPKEWGLGGSDFPEKWVFTLTADYSLIIGAQPLGMIHGKFPFDVIEGEIEGYGLYNRGIPQTMENLQNVMDWLFNSHFFNVRAALNNQFIMDPSRIMVKDAEEAGPGFIFRLKPEAYGQDIRSFFHQVPVSDVTRQHMTDIQSVNSLGERVMGINDAMMGQSSGGRKTAAEVRTTTGFGTNRLKTIAEYMSATAFAPHAQKLVQSSQQYYDGQLKLRIVGDLAQSAGPGFINVDQNSIAGFYDLVPVDGTLPVDRFAQAALWKDLLANLRSVPQVMMQYDVAKIFAWVATLAGIKNINQFKVAPGVQIVPDEQMTDQAQRGNVVPITGPSTESANALGVNAALPQ
jgi:hypothetical protein